ncbi:MAG: hypothetical protein ACRC9L_00225 [Brevinema sp.]
MKTLIAFIFSCVVSASAYAQTVQASVSETFRVSVSSGSSKPARGTRGFERPGRDGMPQRSQVPATPPSPQPSFGKEVRSGWDTPSKQDALKKLAEELSRDVPTLPKDPAFSGLEGFPKSDIITNENGGSVLELWFRKEGISDRDIKMLSQLPNDQKSLIRRIVQSYQIDMQRAILDLRPSYQKIAGELEFLKVELSRSLLDSKSPNTVTPARLLKDISTKEEEMNNLGAVREKLIQMYRGEMKDQIAAVVNSWISAQASKSKENLSELFQDAENTYGLNWD